MEVFEVIYKLIKVSNIEVLDNEITGQNIEQKLDEIDLMSLILTLWKKKKKRDKCIIEVLYKTILTIANVLVLTKI